MNFDALIMNIIKGMAPCVVGLDIATSEVPAEFKSDLKAYNRFIIDSICEVIPAISVNIPALLPCGTDVIADAISYAKEKGMYVIADAKCSGEPIAAKSEAEWYFDILGADCVTVNAFYGAKGLTPFFEKCENEDKNVFVLSHSESGSPQDFQELMAGLRMVYRAICEKVSMWGGKKTGNMGYSNIGIMIGGISNSALRELRNTYKKTFLLLTGYDGEKTSAHDLNGAFDMRGLGGLVYVTRNITLPGGDGEISERVNLAVKNVAADLRLCF